VSKTRFYLSAILPMLVAIFAIAGCGGDDNKSSTTNATTTGTTTTGESGSDHGTKSFASGSGELELDDFYFQPTTVQGKPGQTVTLELKNEGKTEHNFSISAQHVDKDIEAGESDTVKVKVPKSGTVQFFCSYHKSQGMVGTLATTSGGGSSSSDDSSGTGSSGSGSSGSGSSGGGSDDTTTTNSSGGGGY
jgi:plastocyanin